MLFSMHPRSDDPPAFRRNWGIVSKPPVENKNTNASATREPRDSSRTYRKRGLPDYDLHTSTKKLKKTPESVIHVTGPSCRLTYLISNKTMV